METRAGERWFQIAPGIMRRTVASGERMLQIIVTLEAGARLPEHSHPHDQITHVLRGRLRMYLAGVAHDLAAGDSIYIPGGTPHAADVPEETLALDTFSPPREDMVAQDRSA
jgi:quercetin dioxygenase-like cupin family protein